jgi:hypothetical protein
MLWFLNLNLFRCDLMTKSFFHHFLSPSASGRVQTLNLRVMSQMPYHWLLGVGAEKCLILRNVFVMCYDNQNDLNDNQNDLNLEK